MFLDSSFQYKQKKKYDKLIIYQYIQFFYLTKYNRQCRFGYFPLQDLGSRYDSHHPTIVDCSIYLVMFGDNDKEVVHSVHDSDYNPITVTYSRVILHIS